MHLPACLLFLSAFETTLALCKWNLTVRLASMVSAGIKKECLVIKRSLLICNCCLYQMQRRLDIRSCAECIAAQIPDFCMSFSLLKAPYSILASRVFHSKSWPPAHSPGE